MKFLFKSVTKKENSAKFVYQESSKEFEDFDMKSFRKEQDPLELEKAKLSLAKTIERMAGDKFLLRGNSYEYSNMPETIKAELLLSIIRANTFDRKTIEVVSENNKKGFSQKVGNLSKKILSIKEKK